MKMIRFVCHDGQPDVPPLIVIFEVGDDLESEDVINSFGKALRDYVPASMDCPPVRFAADKVCQEYGTSVEFVEADQEFGVSDHKSPVCLVCRITLSEDRDSTSPSTYNTGFSDETEVCWSCHSAMLENRELTRCESCQECFTYSHLLPNKDAGDGALEICPYCGEIWCE